MNLKLADKTTLVSGSTKGIGFAIAIGLAREGARVIVNGRSERAVADAKEHIDQTVPAARVERFAGDLSTAAATETLLQRFPLVDILVNNLGIFEPKSFGDITDEEWRSESAINTPAGMIHYGMTKTAQLAVSRGLAASCAGAAVTGNVAV